MFHADIYFEYGQWEVGIYSIAGNYDDGYTVWITKDGEDSETVYENKSFEHCLMWCMMS